MKANLQPPDPYTPKKSLLQNVMRKILSRNESIFNRVDDLFASSDEYQGAISEFTDLDAYLNAYITSHPNLNYDNQAILELLLIIIACDTSHDVGKLQLTKSITLRATADIAVLNRYVREDLVKLITDNGFDKKFLEYNFELLDRNISAKIDFARTTGVAAVLAGNAELVAAVELRLVPIIEANTASFSELSRTVQANNDKLDSLTELITSKVQPQLKSIEDCCEKANLKLDHFESAFKEQYPKEKKEFIANIKDEVTLNIVGQSYYKYNSWSMFAPTVTLKFKEIGNTGTVRTSELSFRLNKRNEDITDEDLNKLKNDIRNLGDFSYTAGNTRIYYVSKLKHFKTTLFAKNRTEGKRVLKIINILAGEEFIDTNCSIVLSNKKTDESRRITPLDNVDTQNIDFREEYTMKLFRVVLLINGEKRILLIN